MNLSEFCQPFYSTNKKSCGIKGMTSQPKIVEFFMKSALGDMASKELIYSETQFRKWFTNEREPTQSLWTSVTKHFDETRFSRAILSAINEERIIDIATALGLIVDLTGIIDKFTFAAAITKQFLSIANGNGEAANEIDSYYHSIHNVVDFPDYIENAKEKYSKLKTLLYTSDEHNFYDFFVCNRVCESNGDSYQQNKAIKDVNLDKLQKLSQYILLVGMGGIGKSMMMRHLFLSSIEKYKQGNPIPILVTLREFNPESSDLFNLIVDSVHRFELLYSATHLHNMLLDGKCQILLDGLDEIKNSDMEMFQRQLDSLVDRYPKNCFIMSTRKFSNFVGLPRFKIMCMLPFTNEQALELIDRLEYCPEEPKLKQQFRDKLEKEYFRTHSEFVTNPLLLTLMLMNYHRFSDVPEKKHLFYEQAYQTLLQRHDSDKLAYKRVFRSVTDPSDFTLVFREFCAKSYRKGDYEFDRKKFEEYFNNLKSVQRLNSELMKLDNFIFDVCHSACLMYEEGQSYHFLHRSFQEYFFAVYYSMQDDRTLIRLGNFISKQTVEPFDDGLAFDMLYDLAPEKVERFIFLPYLHNIFSYKTQNDQYWHYLIEGYSSVISLQKNKAVIDKYKEKYKILCPSHMQSLFGDVRSTVLYKLLLLLHQKPILTLKCYSASQSELETIHPLYAIEEPTPKTENGEQKQLLILPFLGIYEGLNDEDTSDEDRDKIKNRFFCDGEPVEFGWAKRFTFEDGLKNPESYPATVKLWNDSECPAQKQFDNLKRYYEVLSKKYSDDESEDDDDF